ncbi:transcriptional regulator, MarR family [Bacillus cereus]|nr:transcriptional regulator, MarR family [Bacillus cereus]
MNLHDLIGYLVHRTDVKMTNYFTKKLKPYGVTPEQWGIISVLCSQRSTTQKSWRKLLIKIKLLLLE